SRVALEQQQFVTDDGVVLSEKFRDRSDLLNCFRLTDLELKHAEAYVLLPGWHKNPSIHLSRVRLELEFHTGPPFRALHEVARTKVFVDQIYHRARADLS